METDLLREYLVVASETNLTHAARRLCTTQSTLSKHMATLEREFGEKLFERGPRGMELTQAGSLLYRRASAIVELVDSTHREISSLRRAMNIRVTGIIQNGDVTSLLSRTAQMLRTHADLTFSLVPASLTSSTAMVLDGSADIAINHKEFDSQLDPDLTYIELFNEKLFALVEPDHELAGRKTVSIDDLATADLTHLMGSYAGFGWSNLRAICQRHGFEPKGVPLYIDNIVDCLTYPLDGSVLLLQRGIVPLESFLGGQRCCLPVSDDDAVMTVCAYFRKKDKQHLDAFLDALLEAAQSSGSVAAKPSQVKGRFRSRCESLAREVGLNASETSAMFSFAKGHSIDRIGADLGLSRVMVGDLLANVYRKVGVRDRQELLDRIEAIELPW